MRHIGLGRFSKREGALDPFHTVAKHGKAVEVFRLRWSSVPLLDAPMSRLPRPMESHPGVVVKCLAVAPLLDGKILDQIILDQIGTFGQLRILIENFGTKVQPQCVE